MVCEPIIWVWLTSPLSIFVFCQNFKFKRKCSIHWWSFFPERRVCWFVADSSVSCILHFCCVTAVMCQPTVQPADSQRKPSVLQETCCLYVFSYVIYSSNLFNAKKHDFLISERFLMKWSVFFPTIQRSTYFKRIVILKIFSIKAESTRLSAKGKRNVSFKKCSSKNWTIFTDFQCSILNYTSFSWSWKHKNGVENVSDGATPCIISEMEEAEKCNWYWFFSSFKSTFPQNHGPDFCNQSLHLHLLFQKFIW